ncbi:MAG: MBL fold metallo-hydrolase, partial [Rhodospirillales bacterium]|nr:MBL fold metallo-hydrolase [Rhodospirillales bacterium]
MKVTVLGSGAAGGVPMISRGWGKCAPDNPRNRRRRPSILVEEGRARILVDTGPDLREQLLEAGVSSLDAVLYTHGHADHLHGIDDLREVNRAMGRPLDVYGEEHALADIRARFGYVFEPLDLATQPIYKPLLVPHLVEGPFEIGPMSIVPMVQDHGYGASTGFRFGDFAYSTDVVEMPAASFAALSGVKVW